MKSNGIDPRPDVGIRLLEGHDDSKNMETSSTITSSIWFSKRFFVMVLLFIGCINMYAMRGNLSIAIVEMTSNKTITIGNQTITRPPEFNWDSKTIGVVLTMFSYGYLCSLGGGFLATKFGGSLTYGTNMLLAALVTLLYPISLRTHFYLFLACRALAGLFESFAYASTAEVLSRWVPEKERSTLMAYSFSGIYIGTAVTYPFCGFLANKWGWPMVFYATGLICCTGSLLWLIFVRNEPRKDKWISKKELLYIEQGTENTSRKHIVHPYKSILTSKAFWALSLGKFSYSWGFTILVTCFPLYVKDMTGRATHEIGLISAIPNIVCIFMIPIAGTFMDYCQNNSSLKATQIHKIMMSIAFICGAILFMIVAFVTNFVISMACFVLIKVVLSINFLILQLISIHMAPRHSSVLAGLSAFWYTISTISTPTVIGFIVVNHRLEEWSKCFLLSSGILMFGAIVFILFGSSEIQPWALPPSFSVEENACDKNKKTSKPY